MKIAVWFSCGAASAVAAKLALDQYPRDAVHIVNSPVEEEDQDNRRFLHDVESWLDHPITYALNPDYPMHSVVHVWERRQFMSGPLGAPCTLALKKRPRQLWEQNHQPTHHVLGFTLEERHRHERFTLTERENVLPLLIDARLTKQACLDLLMAAGIELPKMYRLGFPNANCIGCSKATSPTYWNLVRRHFPDVFKQRAEQSRRLGAKLVRVDGDRLFLDELHPAAKGRPLPAFSVDCGLFCEEPGY